jgi:hypothetical protein
MIPGNDSAFRVLGRVRTFRSPSTVDAWHFLSRAERGMGNPPAEIGCEGYLVKRALPTQRHTELCGIGVAVGARQLMLIREKVQE